MSLEQKRDEYLTSLETRVREHYLFEGEDTAVIVKKGDHDNTYGVYLDYSLVCTDETIDVFLAIEDCTCIDRYREAMWELLINEAASHGYKKVIPDLSKASDEDLLDELRRRGCL